LPLVVLGIKLFLDSYLGHSVPFLLFFAPVILVAWHCGKNCGILASVWSGLLATTFFTTHATGFDLISLIQLAVFTAEGTFISILTARCRQAQETLAARAQRQSALAQISTLALSRAEDFSTICDRAAETCAQAMGLHRVIIWQKNSHSELASNDEFFEAVLRGQIPLKIEDLTSASLSIGQQWGTEPCALLGLPIGDETHPIGVLLALDSRPNRWASEETDFLSAVAAVLAIAAQRSLAEESQRKEEARYRAFVEQSSEAIWCCEFVPPLDTSRSEDELIDDAYERGVLSECNDAFAHMYGVANATELLGARLGDLLVRDDPRNQDYVRAFMRSEYRLSDAHSIETDREGNRREFSNNLLGIVENGQLLRAWGTQRDISIEQEANNKLRASEARFRALFDASPVAIAISRGEVLLYVNEASVELLGCQNVAQMIGHPVSEFVASPDRETMQKRIERRAAGFDEPLVYEATSLRRDGTTRPLRIEVGPLELPDGPATLAFAFDLTEEKAAETQRQQLWDKERRSAHRAARLQEITASLAATATLSSDEVAHLIISQGVEALDATSGALSQPGDDGSGPHLRIVASVGYSEEILRKYSILPMDDSLPAVRAFIDNRPFWSGTKQESIASHPVFAEVLPRTGTHALCALPLEVEGRVLGILSLSFSKPQDFDPETRAFMLTLAGQCAQALDRVRLFNEARDAARLQKESLALLNTLLASAPIGIAFYDLQTRHVLVNQALSQIDGVSVEDHWGKTATEVNPLVEGQIEKLIARVIATGQPVSEFEYTGRVRIDSDDVRHILLSFYPVRGEEGEISGVGGMILDITERTRDERERLNLMGELEIERARFEAILQQMPSAVLIAQAPSGRVILSNSQVATILRDTYVPSRSIEDYNKFHGYHPNGTPLTPHEWPLAKAVEAGHTSSGEQLVIARGDGSMAIVRMNAAPIRDRDGQITAGIAIFDDVTQSARADNAQRFLAEAGSALLSTLDEEQIYERLARLCVPSIADWCIVAVLGADNASTLVTIVHADPDKTALAQSYQRELSATAHLPWDESLRGQKSLLLNGNLATNRTELGGSAAYAQLLTEIEAHSVIVSPLGARGRTIGVMIWVTAESERTYDTDDRELADELARRAGLTADGARLYQEAQFARDEAQNANRAKDEFLAVVSHELRTPLTPILGWLELLRTPGANDEMRDQAYGVIERNARAQAQLVNDILDVSRITSGKLRLELKPVELALLVENAIESLRPNAAAKGIRLALTIDNVGLVRADANRVQQVVWNLLQNAIKFTPEQGQITIDLEKKGSTAVLRVSDSGSGIEPEFLPYVFDRFRQADSSSTRKAGGLGLGLAIVSHIVEGHNGRAYAESEGEGKGATFTMELPILSPVTNAATRDETTRDETTRDETTRDETTRDETTRDETTRDETTRDETTGGEAAGGEPLGKPLPRAQAGALDGLNILVTDDEPDTREMMKVLLKSHGAQVRTAGSAHETLALLQNSATDVLISDIGMPLIDGYEMRRELTLRGFEKPSIALTAYTAPRDAQRALDAGFNAHLPKPVDADSLLKLIGKLARPNNGDVQN
jgi:PAS domain S-box-containing protein